jgi:glycosyltransferase 2 family protein
VRGRALRLVVLVVLAAALAYSVRSQWGSVGSAVRALPWLSCVAAMVLTLVAVGAAFLAWRAMLADLGSPLPMIPAAHIFSVSQIGKYLPGSVWPLLAQMELGRRFHVPRLRMATAFLLTVLSGVVVAFAIGGLLAFTEPGWGRAYALLPMCLLVLHPRILLPLSHALSRVLKREPATDPPTLAGVSRTVGWLVVQWLCLGIATAVLADGMGSPANLIRLLGAASLSWAIGLVVLVVPAGAGVREGIFTILLAPAIGSAHALAVALIGRLALTLADALFAMFGVMVARRSQRHDRPASGAAPGAGLP